MIELPWPPKELSPNARVHWGAKSRATKSYREYCFLRARKMQPSKHLRITFCPPDLRPRDRDNIISSFKAGQDGIARAWDVNDNVFVIHYSFGEVHPGGRVIVEAV